MKIPLLEMILDSNQLSVHFQPIFRVGQKTTQVHSVEALIRGPRGTHFERANLLFDYVRRKRAEVAVDRSCFTAVCRAARELPPSIRVNFNVHAATLGQQNGFIAFLLREARRHSLSMERVTVEIVEHAPTCNLPALMQNIAALRDHGVRIALDDVGLGQSNYRMMLDCNPDYFKLDGYFVKNLKEDCKRRAVVESVAALAKALDSSVVAEAVNTREDLAELELMGIEFVQANLMCPAMPLDELWQTGLLGVRESVVRENKGRSREGGRHAEPLGPKISCLSLRHSLFQ